MPKVASNKDAIIEEIPMACADEAAAVDFIENLRGWNEQAACPKCGGLDVYKMMKRGTEEREQSFRWRCRDCAQQYSARTGTVFEDSRIPLRHWCYAFWRASTSKKGVSALEIQRQTGLSYKSALFLMHRIRFAMTEDDNEPLTGTVEVDETYVGGKPRHKGQGKRGRGTKKTPVVAMLQRGGKVRTKVVSDVTGRTLEAAIREHVDQSARIMTDELHSYKGLEKEFAGGHYTVRHSSGEYAKGDITTNAVESFFSRLKRSINGIHHSVSKKHLHRYMRHMEFLHNYRHLTDGERTVAAFRSAEGKRLIYKEPISV